MNIYRIIDEDNKILFETSNIIQVCNEMLIDKNKAWDMIKDGSNLDGLKITKEKMSNIVKQGKIIRVYDKHGKVVCVSRNFKKIAEAMDCAMSTVKSLVSQNKWKIVFSKKGFRPVLENEEKQKKGNLEKDSAKARELGVSYGKYVSMLKNNVGVM